MKSLDKLILSELYKSRKSGPVNLLERFKDVDIEEINKAATDLASKDLVTLDHSPRSLYVSPESFVTHVSSGTKYLKATLTEYGADQAKPFFLRKRVLIGAFIVIGGAITYFSDIVSLLEYFGISPVKK